MNEWQTLTLADVCTVITDGAHQSPKTVSRGKPMASVKDLTRFGVDLTSARHIATEDFEALVKQGCKPHVGDVLIAKDGNSALDTVCTVGHPLDAVLLSSVAILRPDPKCLDSVFLKFYLSSPETIDYLKSNFISGAAIPRVVLRDFKRAEIRLPSLGVQRRIAGVLQSIDSKIDLNHRINQTLEAMAQAIFQSWFVDFDPVKAKIAALAEGRDPLRAAMSAISGKAVAELDALPPEQYEQLAATAALFPEGMEESELGEIPKGWAVQRVGGVLELAYGKALKSTDRQEGNVPVYGSGGITGYHNTPLVTNGSIIVGRKGTVGSLYWEDKPFFPIDTTYYVRPLAAPLTFCYYAMQTMGLEKMNTDAAVPGLNRENVYRLELVLPDSATLQQFDIQVATLREAIHSNLESSKSLADLRDSLLPKLLSGELSVAALTEPSGAA
jgi:type I restriction enzyme S subunit